MPIFLMEQELLNNIFYLLPQILYLSFSSIALLIVNGSRYSKKTTAIILVSFVLILVSLNISFLPLIDIKQYDYAPFFTMFLPQAVLSFIIAKKRGIFAVSSTCNAFLAIYLGKLIETNVTHHFDYIYIRYIVFSLSIPIIIYFLKFFYLKLQNIIEASLPKMSYIFLLFSIAVIIEIALLRIMISMDLENAIRVDAFTLTVLVIYILVISAFYIILNAYSRESLKTHDKEMLKSAITALQDKIRIRDIKEKQLRILRHDMKHLLISVASLINNNKHDEAIELINQYTKVIENNSDKNYCRDPFINALLDYYVAACKASHIKFEVKVNNFEDVLDIPPAELSIFISNCLDNAIRASMKLSEEKRFISFTFLNNDGRLILRIRNNYNGTIILDENKKPTSIYSGHGIGTTSIQHFADRHGLMLNYDIKEDTFTVNALFSNK